MLPWSNICFVLYLLQTSGILLMFSKIHSVKPLLRWAFFGVFSTFFYFFLLHFPLSPSTSSLSLSVRVSRFPCSSSPCVCLVCRCRGWGGGGASPPLPKFSGEVQVPRPLHFSFRARGRPLPLRRGVLWAPIVQPRVDPLGLSPHRAGRGL